MTPGKSASPRSEKRIKCTITVIHLKVSAVLVREADNAFDANAVRIEIGSRRAGYLSREMALQYREALGESAGQCSAKIVGGFDWTMAPWRTLA
jgi:hypothetical protein